MCLCKIKLCLLLCKLVSHIIRGLLHYKCLLASHTRTGLCTGATSGTVSCRYGNSKIHTRHTHHRKNLHVCRCLCLFLLCHGNRTDNRMRTYHRTTVTLNTILRDPLRNINSHTTTLMSRRTTRCGTISIICKSRNRQLIATLCIYFLLDILNKLHNLRSVSHQLCNLCFIHCICPVSRNLNLYHAVHTCLNSSIVHLNNCITLLAIALLCSVLHILNRFLSRDDIC